jgi:hypothetical protein
MYIDLIKKVKEKKSILLNKIKDDQKKVTDNCLQDIETLFEKFRLEINNFVENNYDLKKDALERAWASYAKETMKIEKRVEEVIQKQLEQEQKDIQEYLSDWADAIDSFFKFKNAELTGSDLFNTRKAFSIVGTGLGVVGSGLLLAAAIPALASVAWIPVAGWILVGAGVLVGLLSMLFKSKEKKRKEAIEKLSDSLQRSMDENNNSILKQIPKIIEDALTEISNKIEENLSNIQIAAEAIELSSKTLLSKYEKSYNTINSYFAKRICDFCINSSKQKLEVNDYSNLQVERDYGKSILIKTDIVISEKKIEDIQNILQENIIILKLNQEAN